MSDRTGESASKPTSCRPNGAQALPTASFALRPEQIEQIRTLAAQRNTSQSAIVREAIDLLMRDTVRQALEQLQRARGVDEGSSMPGTNREDRPAGPVEE